MVILQFNKLIRNKWVWGVFAILVSAAFCFDDFFRPDSGRDRTDKTKFTNLENVDMNRREDCRAMLHLFDRGSQGKEPTELDVDKAYASLRAFEDAGLTVSDATLAKAIEERFLSNPDFDRSKYAEEVSRTYQMDVQRFESLFRQYLTLQLGYSTVLNAASWVDPSAKQQYVRLFSDKFSIRLLPFEQTKEEAEQVKVGDDEVKAWYDEHTADVTVPESFRVRFVAFDLDNTNLVAKLAITDDAISARYERDLEKVYTTTNKTTDTNGVESVTTTVRKLEEVSGRIRSDLEREALKERYQTPIAAEVQKANADFAADPGARQDDLIASLAETYEVPVVESADGVTPSPVPELVNKLVKRPNVVMQGLTNFQPLTKISPVAKSRQRYALITDYAGRKIWVVEAVDGSFVPARKAELEEVKEGAAKEALTVAKAKAFADAVEDVRKEGLEAALKKCTGVKAGAVSMNEEAPEVFAGLAPDVVDAVKLVIPTLAKGELSELFTTGEGKGVLIVCDDRVPGEASVMLAQQADYRLRMCAPGFVAPLQGPVPAFFPQGLNRERFTEALLKAYGYTGDLKPKADQN